MRRRWSLRRRLLLALVLVTAVVTMAVGVISVVVLQSFLLDRLDQQLTSAQQRSTDGRQRPPDSRRVGPDSGPPEPGDLAFLLQPGQAAGTLGAEVDDGTVVRAAVLDGGGRAQPVDEAAYGSLGQVEVDDEPRTIEVAGLGSYRVLASGAPDGTVVLTGLPLDEVTDTSTGLVAILLAATLGGCVVVLLAGGLVVGRAMRPLAEVTTTATRVRTLDLTNGEGALPERVPETIARTPDEVGEVASALNLMLDHVEDALSERHRSETRVRQFVADASHELRTPLASIRGYAELMRRRPGPLPPDLGHALARVESEADRMGGLVDDLLLLARLDAGRPVAHELVDLVPVVIGALGDAHAADRDHRWQLNLPGEAPVVVLGDQERLHQVVANLLGNSRVHTPAGTTVTLCLLADGDQAVLRVTDDGPGVGEDVRASVFERFVRADSSRARVAGSTGLGLAIVEAVVHAHGGQVTCPRVEAGAVFEVRLPLAQQSCPLPD